MKRKVAIIFVLALLIAVAFRVYPALRQGVDNLIPTPTTPTTPTTQPSPGGNAYAMDLAAKYSPIIHLPAEDRLLENYEPKPVEIMIDQSNVLTTQDPLFREKASIQSLLQWSREVYFLDIAGLGPKTNSRDDYKASYEEISPSYAPTVYARIQQVNGQVVLQYWLFYYLNDWRNIHEGDWELIQLDFSANSAEEVLTDGKEPLFAAYSQHQGGQRMAWTDMKSNGLIEDTHPKVYVAKGSHANYFTPGHYWAGLDFDDTGLTSWKVIRPEEVKITLLPEPESQNSGFEWLDFKGNWGERLGFAISVLKLEFRQDGPKGPPWAGGEQLDKKWSSPPTWAAGLAEYPEPFWTALIGITIDWEKLAIFSVFSPGELHIYDGEGRHVGRDDKGDVESLIEDAIYINPSGTDYKTILIPNADVAQSYRVVVEGTGLGTAEIKSQVPDEARKAKRFLEYTNVPLTPTTTCKINILAGAPSLAKVRGEHEEDESTELELDSDGDDIYETSGKSGDFEKTKRSRSEEDEPEATLPTLKALVSIEPGELDLTAPTSDSLIKVSIELPQDYSPKDIKTSSVHLMGEIGPTGETQIVDEDGNGIPELVVYFEGGRLVEYLRQQEKIEDTVTLEVTGLVGEQPFGAPTRCA